MTISEMIGFAINASMFLLVFALGLRAQFRDLGYLFRHPSLFFRSILAMNIAMLAFAIAVCLAFEPPAPIRIALVALAVSPVPPILPGKQLQVGGSEGYTLGLLAGAALVSIGLVPTVIELIGRAFGFDIHEPVGTVTSVVLVSVIVPLVLGMAIRHFAPAFAERVAKPVSIFATVLLIAAFLPVLVVSWKTFWPLVGNGVLVCLVGFTLFGVAVGHILGGPNPGDRAVLALTTGTRHPGIAMAVASINFPDEKAVFAVVLFHLIIGGIVSLPYVNWRKRAVATTAR